MSGMRVKWQMNSLRKKMLREKILYLKAQVDLAKQNMIQMEKRTNEQQELVTHVKGRQEEEKEALNALKAREKQMQEEQQIKEEHWRDLWQNGLLLGAPLTRQRQLKRNWLGERLDSLNLSPQNESGGRRFVLDERAREKLNQELTCKRKQLKRWKRIVVMEKITLKTLHEDFTHHFQFLRLSGSLKNQLARLQRMNREDNACHPR